MRNSPESFSPWRLGLNPGPDRFDLTTIDADGSESICFRLRGRKVLVVYLIHRAVTAHIPNLACIDSAVSIRLTHRCLTNLPRQRLIQWQSCLTVTDSTVHIDQSINQLYTKATPLKRIIIFGGVRVKGIEKRLCLLWCSSDAPASRRLSPAVSTTQLESSSKYLLHMHFVFFWLFHHKHCCIYTFADNVHLEVTTT